MFHDDHKNIEQLQKDQEKEQNQGMLDWSDLLQQ